MKTINLPVFIPSELKKFDIMFPNEDVLIVLNGFGYPSIIGTGKLSSYEGSLRVEANMFSYILFDKEQNLLGVVVEAGKDNKLYLNHLRYLVR